MRASSLLGHLLDFFDELSVRPDLPADVVLSRFFRARRYLGSRDRRFIGDGIYAWIRHGLRGATRWRLWTAAQPSSPPAEGRMRHVGTLLALAADGRFPWGHEELALAARTFAAAQGQGWSEVIDRALAGPFPGSDAWPQDERERLAAECSLPQWIFDRLAASRGPMGARALGERLLEPAPVDVRVALSIVEREVARAELERLTGGTVAITPLSPAGLRLAGRVDLKRFQRSNPGWIEVQDEGSQLAALAASPAAGDTIIDACAGGGGKILALADIVKGDAVLHACDIDAAKLDELSRRAAPLALPSLTVHPIEAEGPLPTSLPRHADLVLVDAPCSGLGSLRRNPDLKARWTESDLPRFHETQRAICERFAERVRPGGRLVYITCSILADENERVVEGFLASHPDFTAERPQLSERLPAEAAAGAFLRLDPATTGTDGFFVANLRRRVVG